MREEVVLESLEDDVAVEVDDHVEPEVEPGARREARGALPQDAHRAHRAGGDAVGELALAEHDLVGVFVGQPEEVAEVAHRATLEPDEEQRREVERATGKHPLHRPTNGPALRHRGEVDLVGEQASGADVRVLRVEPVDERPTTVGDGEPARNTARKRRGGQGVRQLCPITLGHGGSLSREEAHPVARRVTRQVERPRPHVGEGY